LATGRSGLRGKLLTIAAGKVCSSLLSVATLALLARVLSADGYSIYVKALAALELAVALSTFGLDWLVICVLPTSIAGDQWRNVRYQVVSALRLRALQLGSAAVLVVALTYCFSASLSPSSQITVALGALIFTEGMLRFSTAVVLDSVLAQGLSQLAWLLRTVTMFGGVAYLWHQDGRADVLQILSLEIVASAGSGALALSIIWKHVSERAKLVMATGGCAAWPSEYRKIAFSNYGNQVISTVGSPQALLLATSQYLSPLMTAQVGFAMAVVSQIRRYLPTELFLGMVRPVLLTEFAENGDFVKLNRGLALFAKISLLVLLPVAVALVSAGNAVVGILGGVRFGDTHWLVSVALIWLLALVYRRISELYMNAVGAQHIWLRGAFIVLMALPCSYFSAAFFPSALGVVIWLAAGELLANAYVWWALKRTMQYQPGAVDLIRVLAAAVLASAAVMLVQAVVPMIDGHLVPILIVVVFAVFLAALAFGVLSRDEVLFIKSVVRVGRRGQ
jgi:hypothetical protein